MLVLRSMTIIIISGEKGAGYSARDSHAGRACNDCKQSYTMNRKLHIGVGTGGARGARAPPKFDLSRSRVQLMLTRVAVMESDSASETKSVTEITPPKKLKQSTIVYSLVPNLLVVQVL